MNLFFVFIFLAFNISAADLWTQFKQNIKRTCMGSYCRDLKIKKFNKCQDNECHYQYVKIENLIIQKCFNGPRPTNCIETNNRLTYQRCENIDCVKTNISSLEKAQKVSSFELPIKSTLSKQEINNNDDQFNYIKESNKVFLSACQTKECENNVTKKFNQLGTSTIIPSTEKVSNEIAETFKSDGVFSEKMIQLFKAQNLFPLQSQKNLQTITSTCNLSFEKDLCIQNMQREFVISRIADYFGFTVLNGKNGPVIKANPGYELAKGHLNKNTPHYHCTLQAPIIQSKNLFENLRFNILGGTQSKYPLVSESTNDPNLCSEKFEKAKEDFKNKIVSLGNPPHIFIESIKSVGDIEDMRKEVSVKGNCSGYIFYPDDKTDEISLKWYSSEGKNRILKQFSLENVDATKCLEESHKLVKDLDPSRWQEYSYYLGNILQFRISSKMYSIDQSYSHSLPLIKPYLSKPKCIFTSTNATPNHTGSPRNEYQHDRLDNKGSCEEFCEIWKKRKEEYNAYEIKNGRQARQSNYRCELDPQILQVSPFAIRRDIAKFKDDLFTCEIYNHKLSNLPLIKAYAKDERSCYYGDNQIYINYSLSDFERVFNLGENNRLEIRYFKSNQ